MTYLWAHNTAKSALKSTHFAYFFTFHIFVLCFAAVDCVGTLVKINNGVGNHAQCISMLSTPFNALLCMAHMLG